ncbi:MAG: chloride channel protein [Bdellovibrionales bacterium]|nr:chloride channel protein [Bdellovibrionales bacterium]
MTTALTHLRRWALAAGVGLVGGLAVSLFIEGLHLVTALHGEHPQLVWAAPAVGFAVAYVYWKFGKGAEKGNDLLLEEIHEPRLSLPVRMAPLILVATWLSHLVGASVGREGTAVQMSGALSEIFTKLFKSDRTERRLLLIAGLSAGFAAVFATPLAGTIFGVEVLAVGSLSFDALGVALVAALVAWRVPMFFRFVEAREHVEQVPVFSLHAALSVLLAAVAFALLARGFVKLTHLIHGFFARVILYAPARPAVGGLVIAIVATIWSVERYLGLGSEVIEQSFHLPVLPWDFVGKWLATAWSLGSGFKGGEVTPLFYMGSTLGNALSSPLGLPLAFTAALGFVGVFAGAANTPLACTVLAVECFGSRIGIWAAVVCTVSHILSGREGIYHSQRHTDKKWIA